MYEKKSFPILYRKTAKNNIQQWLIEVDDNVISTTYGQLDGKLQTTIDIITAGKNLDKANRTSAREQALLEAEAKWIKQKKKGYVESQQDAQTGVTDDIVKGGILPMLAPSKSYPTDNNLAKKICFPAYIQPKLDGIRCIAIIESGTCTLWSRTRKPINSVPHIQAYLANQFPYEKKLVLDGELYNHEYRNSFEDLVSIIRQEIPDRESKPYEVIQFHTYDMISSMPFESRYNRLTLLETSNPIILVPTVRVETQEAALEAQRQFEIEGYEGAMIRNSNGLYESGRRSHHLQKMKSFQDDEFPITGIEEGRGRDIGTVGAFICRTNQGDEFKARLRGSSLYRKELFEDRTKWENKLLTVTFKRYTAYRIPYLPIGKAIRDKDY